MNHMHMETRIEAPVEHVWAYLCDPSHMDDWNVGAKYSDFSGPLDRVGTTWVATSRTMGFEMKGTLTVMEVEPLRLLHVRSATMTMDAFYRFAPEGEATRMTLDCDYDMPGHIPGFIKNLWSKSFVERQTRRQVEDIKALAEATVPVTA